MFGKNKVATLVAEFLGTGVLTFLVLSVQRSSIGVPFFVAMAAALSLALMIFVFGDLSGGYFNPALAIGMWTARRLSTLRMVAYVVVEMLGGWGAYGLYKYFTNSPVQAIGGHYTTRILIAEAVGTAVFALGFAMAVYRKVSPAAFSAFAGIAFMVGIVAASTASVGLLNPAVALGVKSWVWGTYVAGPVIGAIVGINLYDLLFASAKESSSVLKSAFATPAGVSVGASTSSSAKKSSSRAKSKK